jgi:electron transport complex protein RnfG
MKWVAPRGYNGDIELAMAVDRTGQITGLSVLTQHETPGFGAVIGELDSSWIDSFRGRSIENIQARGWQLRSDGGDIDGISGATITADAVVTGVFRALSYLEHSGATMKTNAKTVE